MQELIEDLGELIEAGEWVQQGKDWYHSSGKVRILVQSGMRHGSHSIQMKSKGGWQTYEMKDTLGAAKAVANKKLGR